MEYFPTAVNPVYDVLEMRIHIGSDPKRTIVGYICMDHMDACTVITHFYILPKYRTAEVIIELVNNFKAVTTDYMKEINKSVMMSSCNYDDIKVKRMFDAFGFDTVAHWVGTIKF